MLQNTNDRYNKCRLCQIKLKYYWSTNCARNLQFDILHMTLTQRRIGIQTMKTIEWKRGKNTYTHTHKYVRSTRNNARIKNACRACISQQQIHRERVTHNCGKHRTIKVVTAFFVSFAIIMIEWIIVCFPFIYCPR